MRERSSLFGHIFGTARGLVAPRDFRHSKNAERDRAERDRVAASPLPPPADPRTPSSSKTGGTRTGESTSRSPTRGNPRETGRM